MAAAHKVETCVIGAGVLGLACSRSLAMRGKEVLILERAAGIGSGTSSRNSEVIHAGLYYPQNSLKAKYCVKGRDMLYDYCTSRSIPHRRIGKIILAATDSQRVHNLPDILSRAKSNGVNDLQLLSSDDVQYLEPDLTSEGGLYSPSTGIIDSHEFMMALLADAEACGATLALHCEVEGARRRCGGGDKGGIVLRVAGTELQCDSVVNCAGLYADHVCNLIVNGGDAKHSAGGTEVAASEDSGVASCLTWGNPRQYYAKGNYFKLEGQKSPFCHLVYPIPEPGGLGVHATVDLAGSCRFGPDVEWIGVDVTDPDDIDMTVDPDRANSFYGQIRKYWPGLRDGGLVPDYAGVRPKIGHPNVVDGPSIQADFVLEGPREHGIGGFVNMLGIESPGLTSSMALADDVGEVISWPGV